MQPTHSLANVSQNRNSLIHLSDADRNRRRFGHVSFEWFASYIGKSRSTLFATAILLVTLATPRVAAAQLTGLTATQGLFEDRVVLNWTGTVPAGESIKIRRINYATSADEVIAVRARTETEFVDRTVLRGASYEYHVYYQDPGAEVVATGYSKVFAPTNVTATYDAREDGVLVTWSDRSDVEARFIITRNVSNYDTTAANTGLYLDTGAVSGQQYTYCVIADDGNFVYSAQSCAIGRRAVVAPPGPVTASDGQYNDFVRVTFADESMNEDEFRIYTVDDAGIPTLVGTIPGDATTDDETFDDTGALFGIQNFYCVVAMVGAQESKWICDYGVRGLLASPTNVVATYDDYDDRIAMTWENTTEIPDGFKVRRTSLSDDVFLGLVGSAARAFTDATAKQEIEYTYCVTAFSTVDADSTFSDPSCSSPGRRTTVLPPTTVAATDSAYEDRVGLTWTDGSTTAMLFNIYRDSVLVDNVPPSTPFFVDDKGPANMDVTYCVTAVSVTNGAFSAQQSVEMLKDAKLAAVAGSGATENETVASRTFEFYRDEVAAAGSQSAAMGVVETAMVCDMGSRKLLAPTQLTASYDEYEDHVQLSWTDNSKVEAGYIVRRVDSLDTVTLVDTVAAGRQTMGDFGGTPGVEYEYQVTAFDKRGSGGESAPGTNVGYRSLDPPTAVQATDGTSETEVTVTWKDNSRAETGYQVSRNGVLIGSLGAGVTSYTDIAASLGVHYQYSVVAIDALGSSTAASDSGYTAIHAPAFVSLSNTYENSITVVWEDRSGIEYGYLIYSGPDDTAPDAVEPPNTTSSSFAVASGSSRQYCVRALGNPDALNPTIVSEAVCAKGATTIVNTEFLQRITESQSVPNDSYGGSVSMSGNLALVGAYNDNTAGSQDGSVYLYERDPVTSDWSLVEKRLSDDTDPAFLDLFGSSVSVSGTDAIVGASGHINNNDTGRAIFYEIGNKGMNATAAVKPSSSSVRYFGQSVAMSGNNVIVGAAGYAFFYRRDSSGNWSQNGQVVCDFFCFSNNDFGAQVAISGDLAIVGESGNSNAFSRIGSAHIYRRNPSTNVWTKEGPSLIASDAFINDGFGARVAISGDLAIVGSIQHSGAGGTNKVYVFRYDPTSGTWGTASTYLSNPVVTEAQIIQVQPTSVSISGKLAAITTGGSTSIYKEDGAGQFVFKEQAASQGADYVGAASIAGDGLILGASTQQAVYLSRRAVDVIIAPPADVVATDGTFDSRVQITWNDRGSSEDGYRVYRDGGLIAELSADVESYSDFDVSPGVIAEYCVAAVRVDLLDTERVCDFGLRPPDGTIGGRIAAPVDVGGQSAGSAQEDAVVGRAVVDQSGPSLSTMVAEGQGLDPTGISAIAASTPANVCLDPNPNRAIRLDGEGGYMAVPDIPLDGDKTACAWIKTSTTSTPTEGLMVAAWGSTDSGDLVFWHIYNGILLYGQVGAGFAQVGTNVSVATGDWVHACVVKQGGNVTQYVNGTVAGTASGFDFPVVTNTTTIGAFRSTGTPASFYEGAIDEVKFWDRALSPSEVAADMAGTKYTGSETGLVGYWPLDQGAGRGAVDKTSNARHGQLEGGAQWTEGAFKTCVDVNEAGNYTISDLLYRESSTYTVTPNHPTRSFEPRSKDITLKKEQPIENQVDFTDKTLFPISGLVQFDGTSCPVPDVQMFVDGINKGNSEDDGTYRVSVSPSADPADLRRLVPKVSNQNSSDVTRFVPDKMDVYLTAAQQDVNFVSMKKRVLHGNYGGSCAASGNLGSATLHVFTENGCFDQTFVVGNGAFDLNLPPQKYLVEVTNVTNAPASLQADMIRFFDDLGAQEVDLTMEADTVSLIFRPNLVVHVDGLPAPPASCSSGLTADSRTIPNVPIIGKYATVPLTLTVQEDYGNGNFCTVTDGNLQVFDAISDLDGTPQTFDLSSADGVVHYDVVGATPNLSQGAFIDGVDRSYQKSFTAIANVVGKAPASATEWALVEGTRVRTSEFISATTTPFPLLILRDPPGSESSAYLEKGTKTCDTINNLAVVGGEQGTSVHIEFGFTSAVSVGFGIEIETGKQGAGGIVEAKAVAGRDNGGGSGLEICTTTTEKWSTSTDASWTGEDLYMGVALNLVFAKADQLAVNACNIDIDETLAADFKPEDAFETTYVYGTTHIQSSLIPALEELIEISGGDSPLKGDPDGNGTEDTVTLQEALDNWKETLANADSLEQAGLAADDVKNISFSSGADYEYSHSDERTDSQVFNTRIHASGEFAFGVKAVIFDFSQEWLFQGTVSRETTWDSTRATGNSRTVGYTLSDGDTGDFFSVDVGTDPRYKTPVFGIVSGRSSKPWEQGPGAVAADGSRVCGTPDKPCTQRRDWPEITVNPPVLRDIDPEEAGHFEVTLTNKSENNERRQYVLAVPGETNPRNLGLTVTGDLLGNERQESFTLNGGESRTVNIDVLRVSPDYSYENVALMLYPAGDYEIWKGDPRTPFATSDTAFVSVYFDAPCSEINILRPESPWYYGGGSSPLQVILDGIDSDVGPSDSLVSVGMDYRLKGQPNWYPALDTAMVDLGLDATSWTTFWIPPQDGEYELRARTECVSTAAGADPPKVYSAIAEGIVDTKAPLVFGTPEPADQILTLGRDIAVTFDEAILCKSIVTNGVGTNTTLSYASGPNQGAAITGLLKACDGRKVILSPPSSFDWAAAEGLAIEASMDGVTDLSGNPIAGPVDWLFSVKRSAFTWAPANVDIDLTRSTGAVVTTQLVNGRGQDAMFEIAPTFKLGSAVGDTAIVSPTLTSGTVVPGGTATVSFEVPDTLALGTYTATINATRIESGFAQEIIPFFVTANVVCAPPTNWTVNPPAFEYSMTLTARLNISGVNSTDGNDRVVAMVGNEVRGVANIDNGLITMVIYSNTLIGETVHFEAWDDSGCTLYDETSKTIVFENNTKQGSISDPAIIGAPFVADPNAINLAAGWTWMSLNKTPIDASVGAVLADVVASPGDLVKNNAQFSIYDEQFGWVGTLTNINPGPGYQVYLQQSGGFVPGGAIVNLGASPISVNPGWNWIGYLPQAGQPVNDALNSLTPADGDVIKSQYGFAQYDTGTWYGSLTDMMPGLGYQLNVTNAGTLTYAEPPSNLATPSTTMHTGSGISRPESGVVSGPSRGNWTPLAEGESEYASVPISQNQKSIAGATDGASVDKASSTEGEPFSPRNFESTMTVTASVTFDGEPLLGNDGYVWIVDQEDRERGHGRVKRVESGKGFRLFLMVYGTAEDESKLTVRARHPETGKIVELGNRLTFSPGVQIGTIDEPVLLNLSEAWDNEAAAAVEPLPEQYSLEPNYPNPFGGKTVIHYELPTDTQVRLTVYDLLGREVLRLVDDERKSGRYDVTFDASRLASGVYVYRIKAGDYVQMHKMTLVK